MEWNFHTNILHKRKVRKGSYVLSTKNYSASIRRTRRHGVLHTVLYKVSRQTWIEGQTLSNIHLSRSLEPLHHIETLTPISSSFPNSSSTPSPPRYCINYTLHIYKRKGAMHEVGILLISRAWTWVYLVSLFFIYSRNTDNLAWFSHDYKSMYPP